MAWIKKRPWISARCPPLVYPGQQWMAEITLAAKRPVPIDALTVRLVASEHVHTADRQEHQELITLVAKLSSARELPEGETRFSCLFELPEAAPASFAYMAASTSYVLDVHADIPWWPDARQKFVVHVGRKPQAHLGRPEQAVYSSKPTGARPDEPYAEVSLADRWVAAGGTLVGAVALGNVEKNDYTAITYSLIPVQTLWGGTKVRGTAFPYQLPLDRVEEGAAIPFELRLPELPPSAESRLWKLDWWLNVAVHRRYGRDLAIEVPLVIVAAGERARMSSTLAVPTLGNARVGAVWRHVAEKLGLTFEAGELVGQVGDVTVRISREHGAEGTPHLTARLRFPSFELHLDGGELSGFRRLVGAGRAPGSGEWERLHYVAGREQAQVEEVWRALFGGTITPDSLSGIVLADLSDEELALESADAGLNEPAVRQIAGVALELARLVPLARDRIPPPASMAPAVPAWREAAETLGGKLELARMAIEASLNGERVEIATEWDVRGHARHTRVSLHPEPKLGSRRLLEWSARAGFSSGSAEDLPELAHAALTTLQSRARSLSITPERLDALLDAPLLDPAPLRAVVPELCRLADALRVRAGAYR